MSSQTAENPQTRTQSETYIGGLTWASVEKNLGEGYARLAVSPGLLLLKIAGQATDAVFLSRFTCSDPECSSRRVYGVWRF